LCPPGTYSDSYGKKDSNCTLCPVGTASNASGIGYSAGCRPCAEFHKAPTPGSTSCANCTGFCPKGGVIELPEFFKETSRNEFDDPRTRQKSFDSNFRLSLLLGIILGIFGLEFIPALIIILIMLIIKPLRKCLKNMDCWYSLRTKKKKIVKDKQEFFYYARRSYIGGILTIGILVGWSLILVASLINFTVNNILVTDSLQASAIKGESGNSTGYFGVNTTFTGQNTSCAGYTIQTIGFSEIGESGCEKINIGCRCYWQCEGCSPSDTKLEVFFDVPMVSGVISYMVSVPHYWEEQQYVFNGSLKLEQTTLLPSPSTFDIALYPTIYRKKYYAPSFFEFFQFFGIDSTFDLFGYISNLVTVTRGSIHPDKSQAHFKFTLSANSFLIAEKSKQPFLAFIGQIGSLSNMIYKSGFIIILIIDILLRLLLRQKVKPVEYYLDVDGEENLPDLEGKARPKKEKGGAQSDEVDYVKPKKSLFAKAPKKPSTKIPKANKIDNATFRDVELEELGALPDIEEITEEDIARLGANASIGNAPLPVATKVTGKDDGLHVDDDDDLGILPDDGEDEEEDVQVHIEPPKPPVNDLPDPELLRHDKQKESLIDKVLAASNLLNKKPKKPKVDTFKDIELEEVGYLDDMLDDVSDKDILSDNEGPVEIQDDTGTDIKDIIAGAGVAEKLVKIVKNYRNPDAKFNNVAFDNDEDDMGLLPDIDEIEEEDIIVDLPKLQLPGANLENPTAKTFVDKAVDKVRKVGAIKATTGMEQDDDEDELGFMPDEDDVDEDDLEIAQAPKLFLPGFNPEEPMKKGVGDKVIDKIKKAGGGVKATDGMNAAKDEDDEDLGVLPDDDDDDQDDEVKIPQIKAPGDPNGPGLAPPPKKGIFGFFNKFKKPKPKAVDLPTDEDDGLGVLPEDQDIDEDDDDLPDVKVPELKPEKPKTFMGIPNLNLKKVKDIEDEEDDDDLGFMPGDEQDDEDDNAPPPPQIPVPVPVPSTNVDEISDESEDEKPLPAINVPKVTSDDEDESEKVPLPKIGEVEDDEDEEFDDELGVMPDDE
jgi:hypothetical protein